jgi:hypothetical protein
MALKQMCGSKVVRIGVCLIIAVFGANLLSAETKVPNEFTSGTPAKASEVNENFTVLNNKIESITNPEKSYSIISSETLDSGLVRTKLYAYEVGDYSTSRYYLPNITSSSEATVFVVNGAETIVNALGKFRGEYTYAANFGGEYESPDDSEYSLTRCPDGSLLPRLNNDITYMHSLRSPVGAFVLSNRGTTNAGVYWGCPDDAKGIRGIEYYYLEGKGAGIYSCISRVAYYGAFTGSGKGWSRASAPSNAYPQSVVGIFDRSSNGDWGTYYLEIDAPADCLNLD